MELADAEGIDALTIRALATRLGVAPMAIYHHVHDKDEILGSLVDAVLAEVDVPVPGRPWRAELRRRCTSLREAVRRHPWALGLLDSRTRPGPRTLTAHDAVLGTLLQDDFDVAAAATAFALLDSVVLGFALQEATMPFDGPDDVPELARGVVDALEPSAFPHLERFAAEHVLRPGYDFGDEFHRALELVLDAVGRLRDDRH